MKKVFALLFLFVFQSAFALTKQNFYYGDDFYLHVLGAAQNEEVKDALKKILKSGHVPKENAADQMVVSCDGIQNCYSHKSAGYERARVFLFGQFYLTKIDGANYGIKEKYCDRIYQKEDFKSGNPPGPNLVPDNTVVNVEHTWPQSKFSKRYSKELQKSDMHHLYPTDSAMNSLRGNTLFGEVQNDVGSIKCSASRFGSGSAGSTNIFEPPADHKGHVARSIFYFSIRYDLAIRPEEEVILKKWNHEHPVDAEELARNGEIEKIQGDRNPFVDHAELADQIADF